MNNSFIEQRFCSAPWVHLFVTAKGDVRACCIYDDFFHILGNLNEDRWENIWNGEAYQKLREEFSQPDVVPKGCEKCLLYEKSTGRSLRTELNSYIAPIAVQSFLNKPKIVSLDLRLNTTCDAACCQCTEYNSSRWAAEKGLKPFGITPFGRENIKSLIRTARHSLRRLTIEGGEAFLDPDTFAILDLIKNSGSNAKIFFNTNGSVFGVKGKSIFDYIPYFSTVSIEVSLDAVGKAADYVRFGTKWENVSRNFDKYYQYRLDKKNGYRIWLTVHPTIFVHNVLRLPELLRWLDTNYPEIPVVSGNFLNYRPEFDLQRMSQPVKEMVVQNLLKEKEQAIQERSVRIIQEIVDYIQADTDKECMWSQAVEIIKEQDIRRGNSFLEINPEFEPWMN